jgi:hypothetical protein
MLNISKQAPKKAWIIPGLDFFPRKLFRHRFQAFGADFLPNPANFFALKIDSKFSKSLDIGMADLVSSLTSSTADITYSTHDRKTHNA